MTFTLHLSINTMASVCMYSTRELVHTSPLSIVKISIETATAYAAESDVSKLTMSECVQRENVAVCEYHKYHNHNLIKHCICPCNMSQYTATVL